MYVVSAGELVSSKIEQLTGAGNIPASVLDSLLYDGALRLAVVMAVFVSVFVGTDYSDGTIRNKITLGHHRGSIFLANLIVCVSAAVLMQAIHLLSLFMPGWFLFRDLTATTNEVFSLILLDMLAVNAFTTVLTFLNDALPSSQIMQLESQQVIGHTDRFVIYDLAIMVFATVGGIFVFQREDLK